MRFLFLCTLFFFWPCLEAQAFNPAVLFDNWEPDEAGYSQTAYNGVLSFERFREIPVKVLFLEPGSAKTENDFIALVEQAAAKGYSPIVCVGFSFGPSLDKLAPLYPDIHFIIIDGIVAGPNIKSIIFQEEQGCFLVGYLAAMATRTKKIGFVGGMDVTLIRKFGCAFAQGVLFRDPEVKLYSVMTGDTPQAWVNPRRGEELALQLIDKGVDVIFHASGMTGQGVIRAAEQAGIWAIGVDSNQNHLAPNNMLTSMIKRIDVAVFLTLSQVLDEEWEPGVLKLGLKDGAIDWALDKNNIIFITEEMQNRMDDLTFDIRAEVLKVYNYSHYETCPYMDFEPGQFKSGKE